MGYKSLDMRPKEWKTRVGIILILALVPLLFLIGCKPQKPTSKVEKGKPKVVVRPEPLKKVTGKVKVAFVSLRDGNEEIYVMDANGKRQARLTSNADADIDPQVSPDGEVVVWRARDARGFWQLYSMAIETEKPSLLATKTGGDVLSFSWSSHSTWIAFVKVFESREDRHVWLMDREGRIQTSVLSEAADSSEDDLAWFLDNERLAFVQQTSGDVPKIFWRFVPHSRESLFLSSGTKPSVSPDKKWVAFVNLQGEVAVVATQGGAARVLAQTRLPSDAVSRPQWSPDSKLVIFGALFEARQKGNGVFVVNVDGTGFKKLTSGFNPRWAPDGKRVFFEDLESNTMGVETRQVFSVKPGGKARVQLTQTDLGENHSPYPFVASE